jgi:hypothetical protein
MYKNFKIAVILLVAQIKWVRVVHVLFPWEWHFEELCYVWRKLSLGEWMCINVTFRSISCIMNFARNMLESPREIECVHAIVNYRRKNVFLDIPCVRNCHSTSHYHAVAFLGIIVVFKSNIMIRQDGEVWLYVCIYFCIFSV